MNYIRLSRNFIHNKLIPVTDSVYTHIGNDTKASWYRSVFKYNQEHFDAYEKSGTLSGSDDVFGDFLYWDFDDESNLNQAKADAQELIVRLAEYGVTAEHIMCYFSGKKGFSIIVNLVNDHLPADIKQFCLGIGAGLTTLDDRIYDNQRILRIPLTAHQDTGLFKIPLTLEDLNLSVERIVASAREPNMSMTEFQSITVQPFDLLPTHIKKYATKKRKAKELKKAVNATDDSPFPTIDWSKRIKFLTPEKYVLYSGYFPPGKRHDALMILASTYRMLGYTATDSYRLLKTTIERQAELYQQAAFSTDELWVNIIQTVYSDNWNGGVYGANHPLLNDIVSKLPVYLRRQVKDYSIVGNDYIFGKLDKFMDDLKNHRLTSGIKTFDKNVMLLSGNTIGILGVPGCHAKGTKVVMFDGSLKNVEDVKVGEFLMGPDSQSREVLKLAQGREKMVKIIPNRSESFIVNMNHILHLSPSRLKERTSWTDNINVSVKDYIKSVEGGSNTVAKFELKRVGYDLPENKLPLDPYLFGIWLADGTSVKPEITTMDNEVVEYIQEYCNKNKYVMSVVGQSGKAYTYRIKTNTTVNIFSATLKHMNVHDNKHIPEIFFNASRQQRLELLAGIIDGDGVLESNGCGWMVTSTRDNLASDILRLARSLGFHASLNIGNTSWTYKDIKKTGITNDIYISGLNDTYDVPVRIPRRKIRRVMTTKIPTKYNFTYEVLDEDDYYGFTLDKDHLYLTGDFIVHHNSSKTSLVLNIMRNYSKVKADNQACIFYSLDMNAPMIGLKQIQFVSGQDADGVFEMQEKRPSDYKHFRDLAYQEFGNIDFSFKSGINAANIREDIIKYEESTGRKVQYIVIDYLETIQSDIMDPNFGSAKVAQQIRDIAADLDLLAFILLQTQKSVHPGVPIEDMRSVKDGSLIEQSLSVVIGIWREGQPIKYQDYDSTISCRLLKNRFGWCRSFDLGWNGKTGLITDLTPDQNKELLFLRNMKDEEKQAEMTKHTGW